MLSTLLHWIIILLAPLYILFQGSVKYYDLIIALYVLISIHWSFFRNECIVSYFHKKSLDSSYKLGTQPEAVDVRKLGYPVLVTADVLNILAMIYMARKIGYSVPIFLLIVLLRILPYSMFKDVLILFTSVYYLGDNKYLLPGLVMIIASSFIVKHHEKKNIEQC